MAKQLTSLKIFIASPGGLEAERKGFRHVVNEFNKAAAHPSGLHFEPVGWEETLPAMGRPQEIINQDLRQCDYFILVLADRWGTPSGGTYSSGTEEEYHIALECYQAGTMKELIILFKNASYAQYADPGPQLASVLRFKQSITTGRTHLYANFDSAQEFESIVRAKLHEWQRQIIKAYEKHVAEMNELAIVQISKDFEEKLEERDKAFAEMHQHLSESIRRLYEHSYNGDVPFYKKDKMIKEIHDYIDSNAIGISNSAIAIGPLLKQIMENPENSDIMPQNMKQHYGFVKAIEFEAKKYLSSKS